MESHLPRRLNFPRQCAFVVLVLAAFARERMWSRNLNTNFCPATENMAEIGRRIYTKQGESQQHSFNKINPFPKFEISLRETIVFSKLLKHHSIERHRATAYSRPLCAQQLQVLHSTACHEVNNTNAIIEAHIHQT